MSGDAISALERGVRRRAYPQTVRALAAALGLTAAERSARLLGAAAAWRAAVGVRRPPADDVAYGRAVAAVRHALGADVFAAEWTAGQALSAEQAIAEALAAVT